MSNLQQSLLVLARQAENDTPMSRLFAVLDPETVQALKDVLANPKVSTRAIHKELRNADLRVARESIDEYRKCLSTSHPTEPVN